jgi:hypothetical protein
MNTNERHSKTRSACDGLVIYEKTLSCRDGISTFPRQRKAPRVQNDFHLLVSTSVDKKFGTKILPGVLEPFALSQSAELLPLPSKILY